MGPRLEGRGNSGSSIRSWWTTTRLQWGRVLKDAEIQQAAAVAPAPEEASMGPRLEGRGNNGPAVEYVNGHRASMGPRLEGRGNPALSES